MKCQCYPLHVNRQIDSVTVVNDTKTERTVYWIQYDNPDCETQDKIPNVCKRSTLNPWGLRNDNATGPCGKQNFCHIAYKLPGGYMDYLVTQETVVPFTKIGREGSWNPF